MAAYTQVPLRLFLAQLAWLEAALSRHKLSNSLNAFRCCVNCVAVGDAAQLRNNDDADGETAAVEGAASLAAGVDKDRARRRS